MTKYFVIGDVHGKAGMLNELVAKVGWSFAVGIFR